MAKIRKRLISNKNLEKSLFFRALLHWYCHKVLWNLVVFQFNFWYFLLCKLIISFTQYRSGYSVYIDIYNINKMDKLILKAIHYISKISKQKVTVDSISTYLKNKGAHEIDNKSIIETLNQVKGTTLINQFYSYNIKSSSFYPLALSNIT